MTDLSWTRMSLYGAGAIARVCGLYEITDTRVPGGRFKVKVLQRGADDYMATLNVCLKDADGSPDWMAGLGKTETDALQDALKWFMTTLATRKAIDVDDFEWSDPVDF